MEEPLVRQMDAFSRHYGEIAGMLDERFYPIQWVHSQVWSGAIGTLANDTAIIGFEIKTYPGGARELHGMFAAGALDGITALIDDAIAVAREQDCDVATISSREGWGRVLESRGFAPHQITIMKELR